MYPLFFYLCDGFYNCGINHLSFSRGSLRARPTFHSKLWNLKKKNVNRILQDITSLDIVGRLPSVVVKLFMPSTTSENIWLNDQH